MLPLTQIEFSENLGRLVKCHVAPRWLVASIRKRGLIHAIVVEEIGPDRYRGIAGEKRFLSVRELGEAVIRCSVRGFASEGEARLTALSENVDREDVTLYELTMLVHRLLTKHEVDIDDLYRTFPFSPKTIKAMLRAPEVLSKKELEAFSKTRSRTTAHLYLAAAMKRSSESRKALLAEAMGEKKSGKRALLPAHYALVEHVRNVLSTEEVKLVKFRGKPLSMRELLLSQEFCGWVLRGGAPPFEGLSGRWSLPKKSKNEAEEGTKPSDLASRVNMERDGQDGRARRIGERDLGESGGAADGADDGASDDGAGDGDDDGFDSGSGSGSGAGFSTGGDFGGPGPEGASSARA